MTTRDLLLCELLFAPPYAARFEVVVLPESRVARGVDTAARGYLVLGMAPSFGVWTCIFVDTGDLSGLATHVNMSTSLYTITDVTQMRAVILVELLSVPMSWIEDHIREERSHILFDETWRLLDISLRDRLRLRSAS
jgi:hypothetical protein